MIFLNKLYKSTNSFPTMQTIAKRQSVQDLYHHRVQVLVGGRMRDTEKIAQAIATQDQLRKKIGKWQGAREIRKWRLRKR